ncbi:4487_t:CDS:2, partial [Ambispora leptoticha]
MDIDEETYKIEKELWVTGHNGGSMSEINSVAGVLLVSMILSSEPKNEAEPKPKKSYWAREREGGDSSDSDNDNSNANEMEFLVNQTVKVVGDEEEERYEDGDENSERWKKEKRINSHKPFLSAHRAGMVILTCISILAVDFPAFPRRFAKVETFGTSLMDLGVGSFVFSAGIVAAKPFLKRPENRFKPLSGQLVRVSRQSIPILALGFIRLLTVKGVNYQ